jgi:hypothetical protein
VSAEKSWHTIFDVEPESRQSYATQLASFERHKTALLDILRKAHGGGPKLNQFDEQPAWRGLIRAAVWYFLRPTLKHKTLLPARRVERLQDLAKALRRARGIVHNAVQDDVGIDLFRGWWIETERSAIPVSDRTTLDDDLNAVSSEIEEAVKGIANLAAAAKRAAQDVRTQAGSPSGSGLLSMHDIIALKAVFRRSTGLEARKGPGPFIDLVETFLGAVGRGDDTKQDYVIEALKYADKQARKGK